MSAGSILDLCRSTGPRPYGPDFVWNGRNWVFANCSSHSVGASVGGGVGYRRGSGAPVDMPEYTSAFGPSDLVDGSLDPAPPPTTPPNVLPPGGSIGDPVVEDGEDADCACKAKVGARSILWLVGVGMLLWLI